jgi:hypothetical protein
MLQNISLQSVIVAIFVLGLLAQLLSPPLKNTPVLQAEAKWQT